VCGISAKPSCFSNGAAIVRVRDLTFKTWLRSHREKATKERWLRELYPWPVLAQVDYEQKYLGRSQRLSYDGTDYDVTLQWIRWQEERQTFRCRVRVESEGLGWHSRSFSDEFDVCYAADGAFVTLFHARKEEPLEIVAKAFFNRRWDRLDTNSFKSLAVSRFLAASIVSQAAEEAFTESPLVHYPECRLVGGTSPLFSNGSKIWIGYRFSSEGAFAWARLAAGNAARIVALYFADTKYQFRTDTPPNVKVESIVQLDAERLGSKYDDLIRVLVRNLELPEDVRDYGHLEAIVTGKIIASPSTIQEVDVNEALAALKRPCYSKSELRYQLAAGVVLNAWIENERSLGYVSRKKFYAFKEKIGVIVKWAADTKLDGVRIWAEPNSYEPVLYIRIDEVDFSFRAIPGAESFVKAAANDSLEWAGVRLKPIAPMVLAWARSLRSLGPS
jgi:hypothetical protein